ncbi:hypothetical protein BDF19DRAFT_416997 [Syncephalis fuscata]|nr:hypothetical protein BDF19DRAFT_416997 [Syncephalis fuscata]
MTPPQVVLDESKVQLNHPSFKASTLYYSLFNSPCSVATRLPEECLIHILSFLPLTTLLTVTRGTCRHWRHQLVPHAVLAALRRQQARCTVYTNPPYLNFSWVYSMSQADRLHLSPVSVDPANEVVIFKMARPTDKSDSSMEGWMGTESDVIDAALRAVRHFKVDFSGWPSGASARRFTRRQMRNRERRQEEALRLASLMWYESSQQQQQQQRQRSSSAHESITQAVDHLSTESAAVLPSNSLLTTNQLQHLHSLTPSVHTLASSHAVFGPMNGTMTPNRYSNSHSSHNSHTIMESGDHSHHHHHHHHHHDHESDDEDDAIVEVTDPANQGYANVAAAAVMDADDQEPGTNGPVNYNSVVVEPPALAPPLLPPIIDVVPNEDNEQPDEVANTTNDEVSISVNSSLLATITDEDSADNNDDEDVDEDDEDDDELNSETDDGSAENTNNPQPPTEFGWHEVNAADEWVRAWHRLHATYRPTVETFYTAESIPGYRPSTGLNDLYGLNSSKTTQTSSNKNIDCVDALITGGYTGDAGVSVRYEHHPIFGFRIVWMRVSFAWLLSGWFVSAPDTRGPTASSVPMPTATTVATATATAIAMAPLISNSATAYRERHDTLLARLRQRAQALDPYSHASITPSMGQSLVGSDGTWRGPVRPIFLLDGPDGVAPPRNGTSLLDRTRRGRLMLRQSMDRLNTKSKTLYRKLSCISLNSHDNDNDTDSHDSNDNGYIYKMGPQTSLLPTLPEPMPRPYQSPPHQVQPPIYASRLYRLQKEIEEQAKLHLANRISSDATALFDTAHDTSSTLHWLVDPYNPLTIAWCAGELDCSVDEFLRWQTKQPAMITNDYTSVTKSAARRRRMVETGLCMIGCDPSALWKYKHAKRYIMQGGGDQSVVTVARVAASERAYAKHWKEVAAARNRIREHQRLSRQ